MEKLIYLLVLALLFIFGLLCINSPFSIAHIIALWFSFVSDGSFEKYMRNNSQIEDVFELIDDPNHYIERFSDQIQMIRWSGYTALFVAVTGACIMLMGG